MKNTHQLTKKEAYALFGGAEAVARALGYTSAATAHNWPVTLSESVSDRVRGAALRLGLLKLDLTPEPEPRPARPMKRTRWLAPRGGRSA